MSVARGNELPEYVECRVHVTDGEGVAVAEAKVSPFGFRTRVERGSHWGWPERSHGPMPTVVTDAEGNATIRVPKHITEKLEIGTVTWIVVHDQFVEYNGDHPIDDDPAEIKLANGYRIAARAVDASSGQPITEKLYGVLSGGGISDRWTLADSGILVSRVMDIERANLRLVHLPDDGPALFSDLIMLFRPEGSRAFLKDIQLRPGTRVAGKLSDNVPRPIANGKVIASIVAGQSLDESHAWESRWQWSDVATIEADGTFEIDSLPQGDVVQVIALCDGWLSRSPTQDEIARVVDWSDASLIASFTQPQLFPLSGNMIEPIVAMEPTATLELLVLAPNGDPLEGAEVGMSPNHATFRGGSTILGSGFRAREMLTLPREELIQRWRATGNRFHGVTDSKGKTTIHNLHGRPGISLGVFHSAYEMPIENGRRSQSVSLNPGESKQITIQMQEKGTQVLGE
ncbi:MAG: hypothetical protein R3E01_16175 [Pirellulaceae bacterium]